MILPWGALVVTLISPGTGFPLEHSLGNTGLFDFGGHISSKIELGFMSYCVDWLLRF